MRKVSLSLLGIAALALAGLALSPKSVPAQQTGATEVICNKQFIAKAGATSMTQAVAGVSGQAISVCGYIFNAGAAAATIQLVTGTGVNCNTGQVAVTPVFELGVDGVLAVTPGRAFMSGAGGAALCYVITGTGPMALVVQYWQ